MPEGGFQAPRGTYDLLPEDAERRSAILAAARGLLQGAGYGQIDTPIFEDTDLFARGVGHATDIVRKEMYSFTDQGDRSLTLRPEGTAPVCRAYVEHGMHKLPQPVKLWYMGPMFRQEAPQKGRYRQHCQIGAEAIGSEDPAADAELIDLLGQLYSDLGLPGVRLRLTSIGDAAARAEYGAELRAYLLGRREAFTKEQLERIEQNPLRAFDWSEPEALAATEEAPKMVDRLSDQDQQHFDEVRSLLDAAGIDYVIDPRLVRGLDYYTRTVFEFSCDELGAQSGIGGGGRYDGLIEQLGGKPTPGVGWATGLERIALVLGEAEEVAAGPAVYFAVTEPRARARIFRVASEIRAEGCGATMEQAGRSLKGQLTHAGRLGVSFTVIVGPDEWEREVAQLKDMGSQEQEEIPLDHLRDEVLRRLGRGRAARPAR